VKPAVLGSVKETSAFEGIAIFGLLQKQLCSKFAPAMTSESQDLQQSVQQLLDQQDQLLKKVAALEKRDGKDAWDKLGALSGLLIALVGGLFSYLYSSEQSRQSQISENHQAQLERVQTVGTFMPYLVGNDDVARSVALSEVETLLDAPTAVLIAEHINTAKTASGNAAPDPVVLRFLQNMADKATTTQANKDIANKALLRIRAATKR
jgi:hypothetical protein